MEDKKLNISNALFSQTMGHVYFQMNIDVFDAIQVYGYFLGEIKNQQDFNGM